jgi:hypothetical protein
LLILIAWTGSIGLMPVVHAQEEIAKLTGSQGKEHDNFGVGSSIDRDLIVVSAMAEWNPIPQPGSAYVFRYAGCGLIYHEEAHLTASDGEPGDGFGSCSVSGDVIIIGAYMEDGGGTDSGSAYVFEYDGSSWNETQKLIASDAENDDHFGLIVALEGDVAAIAAPGDDDFGSGAGAVYVFKYSGANWVEEQKLYASDAAADDGFGYPVCLSNGALLVGAYGNDDLGDYSGSAYVFRHDGVSWTEEAKLTASDGNAYDYFGLSAVINGDVVLIGAFGDDPGGVMESGSAYVFRFNGTNWIETAKLTASDGAAGDEFGGDVAVDGDVAIITSWRDDDMGLNSGSAYVFQFDGINWIETAKVTASDGTDEDRFGNSVVMNGDVAVIGARYDDDMGTDSGSAYIFGDVSDTGLSFIGPFPGTAGELNRIDSLCGTPGTEAYFVYGLNHGSTPVPGYPGMILDMADPRLAGSIVSGFEGIATLYVNVPPTALGRTILFQAVELVSNSVSNLVEYTF